MQCCAPSAPHCAINTQICVGHTQICVYDTQMRPIIVSDLCGLTGYSRDQIRGLLAELPRFACRRAEARVARVYSSHDLVLVVLLCRLETIYGLKRSVVSALCEPIAATLAEPREASKQACLIVRVHNATCEYVDAAPLIDDGLVVALDPIFLAIDTYLLPTPLVQRDIGLSAAGRLSKPTNAARQVRPARERAPYQRQRGQPNHG